MGLNRGEIYVPFICQAWWCLSFIPSRLADYAERFDEQAFLDAYGMECCECGCCSFVCPARRPLTQEIKSMRKIQLAKKKKG